MLWFVCFFKIHNVNSTHLDWLNYLLEKAKSLIVAIQSRIVSLLWVCHCYLLLQCRHVIVLYLSLRCRLELVLDKSQWSFCILYPASYNVMFTRLHPAYHTQNGNCIHTDIHRPKHKKPFVPWMSHHTRKLKRWLKKNSITLYK